MKTNGILASTTTHEMTPASMQKTGPARTTRAPSTKSELKKLQLLPILDPNANKSQINIMKPSIIALLAAMLLRGAVAAPAESTNSPVASANSASTAITNSNNEVLTLAVFDFDSKDEAVRDLGPKVATLLNANLSANPNIITVERQELEKALGEQELGLAGTVSPDTAAKVGQLTGAKVLVTGRVFKVENQTLIVAKVIGTETSRVYGAMVQGGSSDSIVDLSSKLAEKIAAVVAEKGGTLTAKVETRDERIAKIKQALGGKTLPVVAVKISEQHYGPHIIDPAANTEFMLILKQCGFQVVDADSKLKPDMEISGEAFSAYGMQKGNLISCKSRIEVKLSDVATGGIIAVDRQTSVGVDIAEQTAAKTALENAADTLAERLLPKLAK